MVVVSPCCAETNGARARDRTPQHKSAASTPLTPQPPQLPLLPPQPPPAQSASGPVPFPVAWPRYSGSVVAGTCNLAGYDLFSPWDDHPPPNATVSVPVPNPAPPHVPIPTPAPAKPTPPAVKPPQPPPLPTPPLPDKKKDLPSYFFYGPQRNKPRGYRVNGGSGVSSAGGVIRYARRSLASVTEPAAKAFSAPAAPASGPRWRADAAVVGYGGSAGRCQST
ncbi:proline-rich protein 2-like [Schistocerca nitens]|uniref:proline-rich protein 2-like n=1 Tax=Schistocerca nitens TaxID=7011 RepID=UPI002117EC2E|nr:proline-rich protein 2-like [Schistocerca nitens]